LPPFNCVTVIGGELYTDKYLSIKLSWEVGAHAYLVVEVVVALTQSDQCGENVIARGVSVVKWLEAIRILIIMISGRQ
jgi:hypothetical protein